MMNLIYSVRIYRTLGKHIYMHHVLYFKTMALAKLKLGIIKNGGNSPRIFQKNGKQYLILTFYLEINLQYISNYTTLTTLCNLVDYYHEKL